MSKNVPRFAQRFVLAASLAFPANDLLATDPSSSQPPSKDQTPTSQEVKQNMSVFTAVIISGGRSNYLEGVAGYIPTRKSMETITDALMNEAFPKGNKWVQDVVPVIEFKPLKGEFQGPKAGKDTVTIPGRGNVLIILDGKTREENRQKIFHHLQEETRALLLESEKPRFKAVKPAGKDGEENSEENREHFKEPSDCRRAKYSCLTA